MTLSINDQQKNANKVFEEMQNEINSLKAELKRKDALLYRWSQLNDPQDFYVCSQTLKNDTEQALNSNEDV